MPPGARRKKREPRVTIENTGLRLKAIRLEAIAKGTNVGNGRQFQADMERDRPFGAVALLAYAIPEGGVTRAAGGERFHRGRVVAGPLDNDIEAWALHDAEIGRFQRGGEAEILFEEICRRNDIVGWETHVIQLCRDGDTIHG